jgi:hypothetical protein
MAYSDQTGSREMRADLWESTFFVLENSRVGLHKGKQLCRCEVPGLTVSGSDEWDSDRLLIIFGSMIWSKMLRT